ncbi:Gfo/Idh/MocA family protein [Paenibacillus methanolicus]|uniref:Virulence factor n=1 Tax=Paenibacillus methanolicus TaxID=582686 RepID=A0A5S5BWQ9_9BACL|nr:Gfo/Idh/MocA family oxidoreductase [Paenibacillus methanolicus]TYP70738.1 virulence factor [Paenibacillus methanolicus]
MAGNRIRVGIVGIGDIARKAYLPILGVHPQAEVVGLMSRTLVSVQAAADPYRIEGRYDRLEALLDRRPELIFVHSATETHYDIVMRCLAEGIHVYVDKPLSCDIGQSEEMAAEAKRQGLLLAVGFNRRFAPMVAEARSWLAEAGGAGTVIVQKNRTKPQKRSVKETLYDDAIHGIDLAMWLCGDGEADPELAAASVAADGDGYLRSVFGMLQSTAGRSCAGAFSMDRAAGADAERVELHGGGRTAIVEDLERAVLYGAAEGSRTLAFGGWDSHLKRRGFEGVVQHTLDSLADPSRCAIRADKVLGSHYMVERLAAKLANG